MVDDPSKEHIVRIMPHPNVLIGSEIAVWFARAYIGIRDIPVPGQLNGGIDAYRVHGVLVVEIRSAGDQGIQIDALFFFLCLQQNLYVRADVFVFFSCPGIDHIRGGNIAVFFARFCVFPEDLVVVLFFQHALVDFNFKGKTVYGWAALQHNVLFQPAVVWAQVQAHPVAEDIGILYRLVLQFRIVYIGIIFGLLYIASCLWLLLSWLLLF